MKGKDLTITFWVEAYNTALLASNGVIILLRIMSSLMDVASRQGCLQKDLQISRK